MEVSVAPDSGLTGKTLKSADLKNNYGAVVLAIRHRGELMREDFQGTRLSGGDSLLLSMENNRIPHLEENPDFIVTSRVEPKDQNKGRMAVAVLVLTGVILTAALNIFPIVVSAILGCLVLLFTGTITTRQAYNAVQWKVIFLLAGYFPWG